MTELDRARGLLTGDRTLVIVKGERELLSAERGVRPLYEILESGEDLAGACCADKVVGKATAFLYRLLKVKAVFARVISKPALEVLREGGIYVVFGEAVEGIINRSGDGICPFEAAVLSVSSPCAARDVIESKLLEMKNRR